MAKEKLTWTRVNLGKNEKAKKALADMIAARDKAKAVMIAALTEAGHKPPAGHVMKIAWGFDGQTPSFAYAKGSASSESGPAVTL